MDFKLYTKHTGAKDIPTLTFLLSLFCIVNLYLLDFILGLLEQSLFLILGFTWRRQIMIEGSKLALIILVAQPLMTVTMDCT